MHRAAPQSASVHSIRRVVENELDSTLQFLPSALHTGHWRPSNNDKNSIDIRTYNGASFFKQIAGIMPDIAGSITAIRQR